MNPLLHNDVVIILPVFNEISRGSEIYWKSLIPEHNITYLFVDDFSTDDSKRVIAEMCSFDNVDAIFLPNNLGKSEAIRIGFQNLLCRDRKPKIVGYLDADGAFSISEVVRLVNLALSKLDNLKYDSLWSSRVALKGRSISRSASRHYIGRVINTFIGFRFKDLPYDTQSGFKLFYVNDSFCKIWERKFRTRWFFEIEILKRTARSGHPIKIWEEPLLEWNEVGQSRINLREKIRIFRELTLMMIWREA